MAGTTFAILGVILAAWYFAKPLSMRSASDGEVSAERSIAGREDRAAKAGEIRLTLQSRSNGTVTITSTNIGSKPVLLDKAFRAGFFLEPVHGCKIVSNGVDVDMTFQEAASSFLMCDKTSKVSGGYARLAKCEEQN